MGTIAPWCVRVAVPCLLLAVLASQSPLVRTGPHFAVHLHATSLPAPLAERLADRALAAAESVWTRCEQTIGAKPGKVVTVHLHGDEPAFRNAQRAAGVSAFRDAYVRPDGPEAHVLLWPTLSNAALELVGLPDPTAHEVIRSAAMLVAASHSAAVVADPWLGEVFAWGVLEEMVNPQHAFGVDPAYDTRRQPLVRKLDAREALVLKGTILDFEVAPSREAAEEDDGHQCLLARTMAAHHKDWAKRLLDKPSKRAGSRAEIRTAAVERALGTNWIKTDALFTKLHQHAQPRFQLTAPMAANRDGKLLCAGVPQKSMQFQSVVLPPSGDYAVRGRFTIQPCGDDAFRIQLDWNQKSMVGFFFAVGKWSIESWEVGGEWKTLASGKAPIHRNVPFDAAVEVGRNVRMLVSGAEIAAWDPGERTMRGRWSVGVNDCVVTIEGLRCEATGRVPPPAPKK